MATLLTSELVANAILYARTTIRVVIRNQDDRMRVEVHDGETAPPARKHYSSLSTTGRGLMLVERLADDWGVTSTPEGKQVWFELSRATESASGTALFDFDAFEVDDILGGGVGSPDDVPSQPSGGGSGPGGHPPRALVRAGGR